MNEQVHKKRTRLVLVGWKEGMEKIAVTKAIQRTAGYALKRAKDCTDALLEGKQVVIEGLDEEKATALAAVLRELGVLVRLE